jgi:hypothetical protein
MLHQPSLASRRALTLAAAWVLACGVSAAYAQEPPGCPPTEDQQPAQPPRRPEQQDLTDETAKRYCQVVSWVLDLRMTDAQKAKLRGLLQDYYDRGDAKRLKEFRIAVQSHAELVREEPAERRRQCWGARPQALRYLSDEAKRGLPEARWLLQTYYRAHPVVLHADPPLTRDIVETWIAFDAFLRAQVLDRGDVADKPLSLGRQCRLIKKRWKSLPRERRYQLLALPGEVSEYKRQWAGMSRRKRLDVRYGVVVEHWYFVLSERPSPLAQRLGVVPGTR